jgi:hypothetical protein
VAQRDTEPGLIVRGDLDPSEENDIIYFAITTDLVLEVGVQEEVQLAQIQVFPNPTAGMIQINGLEAKTLPIAVYDQMGHLIVRSIEKVSNGSASLNLSGLANGNYLIKIGQGQEAVVKEIVIID